MMKTEFSGTRRTFVKCAAIFSGLTVLLGRVRLASGEPEKPLPQQDDPSQGYRLTEHVKKYYETARL
jgi:hypothetical protein